MRSLLVQMTIKRQLHKRTPEVDTQNRKNLSGDMFHVSRITGAKKSRVSEQSGWREGFIFLKILMKPNKQLKRLWKS